jgi:hypothetical protein
MLGGVAKDLNKILPGSRGKNKFQPERTQGSTSGSIGSEPARRVFASSTS